MPCCVALVALLSPRLALIVMAIFSDVLSRSMDSWFIPFIGFLFLPWTTLSYAFMWDLGTNQVSGFEWFIVVFAFLVDLSSYGGGYRARSSRTTTTAY